MKHGLILVFFQLFNTLYCEVEEPNDNELNDYHSIEGKVFSPSSLPQEIKLKFGFIPSSEDWRLNTTVFVDGGDWKGFIKEDGTFSVNGLLPGSYVVEVVNPSVFYEPVRIDINSKGKIRARKLNYIQPSQVNQLPYPLKLKPMLPYKYFQQREQWRITDFLFSPMVLMMVVPCLLILVLPKIVNSEETKKEMENMQMPRLEVPEMSEVLTSFFGGDKQKKKSSVSARKKKE
ncbi:ER membrane protein complex subunit 7 homolog [Artemia franciscana]|uniref:ER membrane protein complex subunit 7 beta-sandwich domain-containing protein n=1 Tax=Artemia franciscana TaxID=6661 RepID=A0AA88I0Q0_ARTSF|nr:hypothetical protein QYM36_003873 [Artemia franciscana]